MEQTKKKKNIFLFLIWLLEGVVVGFGAILPGISGGTLCVAFGMYRPIIELLSNIRHLGQELKKNGIMLVLFFVGVAVGFVGFSGLTATLLDKNAVIVTCVFIGFIFGTIPELWRDAGQQGRNKFSVISMIIGFVLMIVVLTLFKTQLSLTIEPSFFGFVLCGALFGLGFIVPGLSPSTLLMFFGIYHAMSAGIGSFDLGVLVPMAIGLLACALLFSKAVGYAYKKKYSIVSHVVLGVVVATAVMILPEWAGWGKAAIYLVCIVAGAALSYGFTVLCDRIRAKSE